MPVSSKFELYTNKWPFSLSALFPLYIFSPDACLHSCVSSFRQGNRPDPPKAFRSDLPPRHYQSLSAIIVRPGSIRIHRCGTRVGTTGRSKSFPVRPAYSTLSIPFSYNRSTGSNSYSILAAETRVPLYLFPFLPSGLHTQSLQFRRLTLARS